MQGELAMTFYNPTIHPVPFVASIRWDGDAAPVELEAALRSLRADIRQHIGKGLTEPLANLYYDSMELGVRRRQAQGWPTPTLTAFHGN